MELLEIGVKMRKGVFFIIRSCFRSVSDHPFLVCVLCFLIFLYRSFPLLFSLLVSASPVLVCTAVLLGTLLSFGQPNIPEMEREEQTTERYREKKRDEGKQVRDLGDVHREGSLDDTAPLIDGRSMKIQTENVEIWEANRELGVNEERPSDEEVVENHYSSTPKMNNCEHLESDYEKSEADSFDSERVNVDSLDSPPRSPWKRVDDREEEEEEENEALESESDKAESSSPDASMADLIPILDELHPLLDEEISQPDHMSNEGSDAGSESSLISSISSDESDEGTDNNMDMEVADEDNEDGEDEDDVQGYDKEQMKSPVLWTEEDQKNLVDLGSSEIERNQRLENLILRRRARKNMSMVPERNLIDLESIDLGFNIAPISTARKNPFDVHRDSYDNMGLPPIPGSAPSILLPRRNPFDIPYDSGEEKPDLMGDGFQEEFTTVQSREPFFRRHESFNVGPSIFAPAKQERQNARLRPYFVPEHMVSNESSYSPFQRQSSELSDSKVSSLPETESVGSVEDMVERRLLEEDNPPEPEAIWTKEATEESSSGDTEPISKSKDIPEEYTTREPELISSMEHISEHVGHGSHSSEEDEPLEFGRIEKRDVEQDELESQLEDADDHYEERGVPKSLEIQVTGYIPNSETVEQVDNRGSSSSSLSEVSERVFNETGGELSMLERRSDSFSEDPGSSSHTSVGSHLSITLVEGMPLRDPIYDLSPRAVRKNSLSSMSSDVHLESDLGLPPVVVKQMVSFTERESEGSSAEMNVTSDIERLPKSSIPHSVTEDVIFDAPGVEQRSSSFVKSSVEENLKDHHIQGQVPSSSSDKNILGVVECSEDKGQLEEEKHLPISETCTVEIHAPLMEGPLTAFRSITEEGTAESPNSDADVYHEANEKLICTPSAEGNVSLFNGSTIHEWTREHLNEVQVPNTPVGSFEERQRIHIPNIRELDQNISENLSSPLSPDFISIPSMSSGGASPRVDMQTIIEEDDEIKDIDEELLSELDRVGYFTVKKWEPASNEFKKHEIMASTHHAETSTSRVVEISPFEMSKIENAIHSDDSKEGIDVHEDIECISEPQARHTGVAESIDVSNEDFDKRDGHDSPDQKMTKENTMFSKGYEDMNFGISQVDDEVIEDADLRAKKDELASPETEAREGAAEASPQVDIHTTSKMAEPEARTTEDVSLILKKTDDDQIEKPVVLEPPRSEPVTHGMPAIGTRPVEDTTLDHNTVNYVTIDNHVLPESEDHNLYLGFSSDLHVGQAISSESTSLPQKLVLDCNIEEQLKPNSDNGLVEVKADKAKMCLDSEPTVEEIRSIDTEKPDHKVEVCKDVHSTECIEGKGQISKSSSSSSSSGSSSSDSDGE